MKPNDKLRKLRADGILNVFLHKFSYFRIIFEMFEQIKSCLVYSMSLKPIIPIKFKIFQTFSIMFLIDLAE